MPIRHLAVLLAKSESTYGSDPSPASSADTIVAEDLTFDFPVEVLDQALRTRGHLSPAKPIQGRKLATFEFSVPIKGSGAAGTAPEYSPLLLACGLDLTNVASTSDTYAPGADPNDMTTCPSCSIELYIDGLVYVANGCRGNVAMTFGAGQRAMLTFTMTGIPVDAADASLPTISNIDTTDPSIDKTFTMGGVADVIQELSIDLQNDVQPAESVNSNNAYARIDIVGRNPMGTFNPEAALVATRDLWSTWEDGTAQALSMAVGGTAGNILTVTAPKCYLRELSPGERNGILIYDIPFTLANSGASGNDEISLAFT